MGCVLKLACSYPVNLVHVKKLLSLSQRGDKHTMNRVIISLALIFVTSCLLPGQPRKRISDESGREAISRFLAKTQGPQGGQLLSIDDDRVGKSFSFQRFYVLNFRRYPVAPALPESLTYNNL